jgi:type IX secretion system PorP/SprF family membrane protein
LVIGSFSTKGQDIHFSEFFATPLFTNPAFAGHFEGTYRFTGIVRRQWSSVSPQPFQTFGGGVDVHKPLNMKRAGIGLRFSHDYAGLSSWTNTSVAIPLSLKFRLGSAQNTTLTFGFQPEYFQISIDYSKLSFGDQYFNGRYNPEAPSSQQFYTENVNKINFSTGIYLEKRIRERKRIGVGFSAFNITQPDVSNSPGFSTSLPRRMNWHVFSAFQLGSSNFDIMPAGQYQFQGEHDELLLGTAFRYHLSTEALNKRSVQIGMWGRTREAAYLSVGFTKNNLFMGASYDFNLNGLRVASEYLGGWEWSIIYTISTVREKTKRQRQCPDFI